MPALLISSFVPSEAEGVVEGSLPKGALFLAVGFSRIYEPLPAILCVHRQTNFYTSFAQTF